MTGDDFEITYFPILGRLYNTFISLNISKSQAIFNMIIFSELDCAEA